MTISSTNKLSGGNLLNSITNSVTSLTLTGGGGTGLPASGILTLGDPAGTHENIFYGSRSGDVLSAITRGYESSIGGGAAAAWDAGTPVYQLITAGHLNYCFNSAGDFKAIAHTTIPTGWLECNGASLLRAGYPALFAAIGVIYGSADGTHFTLPDTRGEFIRGFDNGRGIDTGRTIGSAQADDLKAHTHEITGYRNGDFQPPNDLDTLTIDASPATQYTTSSTGGTETRPRNVAFMYVIKI